jgi:hypothetical protein
MTNLTSLPSEVREYFAHERRKIVAVKARADFSLILTFDNGEKRLFDMEEVLKCSVFEPFRKFEKFKDVFLDKAGHIYWDKDPSVDSTVVWNNRVDLCSDSCYLDSVPFME